MIIDIYARLLPLLIQIKLVFINGGSNKSPNLYIRGGKSMEIYQEALRKILEHGRNTRDINDLEAKSIMGYTQQIDFDAEENDTITNFPITTIKKVSLRVIFEELMFILRGETNIRSLIAKRVHIWTDPLFRQWLAETGEIDRFQHTDKQKTSYTYEYLNRRREFEDLILGDENFANRWGRISHPMTNQFHNPNGNPPIFQLTKVADDIQTLGKEKPETVAICNPSNDPYAVLFPCLSFYQFKIGDNESLDLNVYQASCEAISGLPYNFVRSSILLAIVARLTGFIPGSLKHTFGEVFIWKNHQNHAESLLAKTPRPLPTLQIKSSILDLANIKYEDLQLIGYDPHNTINAPVAI